MSKTIKVKLFDFGGCANAEDDKHFYAKDCVVKMPETLPLKVVIGGTETMLGNVQVLMQADGTAITTIPKEVYENALFKKLMGDTRP